MLVSFGICDKDNDFFLFLQEIFFIFCAHFVRTTIEDIGDRGWDGGVRDLLW